MCLHTHVLRLAGAVFQSIILNWMYPCILSRVFGWVKTHGQCSIEFEERGSEIGVIVRTWEESTFRRVCVAVLSEFSANTTLEATILVTILDAAGPDASLVFLHGGPHIVSEAFASYLGNGYHVKLVDCPTFDLRQMKRCLRWTAASVIGILDPFSLTEFVVRRFRDAENWEGMAFCPALRKAIIANVISITGLVNVVANIIGVWPLVVLYLEKTGCKDDGDSLIVRSSVLDIFLRLYNVFIAVLLFRRREWTVIFTTISLLA